MEPDDPPSAESVLARLREELQSLPPGECERCRRMIFTELWNTVKGDEALELEWAVTRLAQRVQDERGRANAEERKNSRRSRSEDKARNDAIRADRAARLSIGAIAKKHDMTTDAVRGVLKRSKKARPR